MSKYSNITSEAQFTPTSRSFPAPACMNFPEAGRFRLIRLSLFEPHEGPSRSREHGHAVYHLVLFTEAKNEFLAGGNIMAATRGTCALTGPDDQHCFLPRKKGQACYHAITFAFDRMAMAPPWARVLGHYTGHALPVVPATLQMPESALLRLSPLMTSLQEAMSTHSPAASLQLHFGILQIFAVVAETLQEQQQVPLSRKRSPELNVRNYLDIHYARPGGLATVASQTGISLAHLSRAFKQRYGISPGRYRDQIRLEAARSLLRHSDLLVKEIANQLGYPDAYTFSKAFNRHCHCPPRTFRKRKIP